MLVTGFGGYGGRDDNPSGDIAGSLDGEKIVSHTVTGAVLPVVYNGLAARLTNLIDTHRPVAVICLGLWPGEPAIRLERFAVNKNDFEIPDNAGAVENAAIDPDGPTIRATTLPIDAIEARLHDQGIPARQSSTAGHFLCNASLYTMLGLLEARRLEIPCGFIHIPYLPGQVARMLQANRGARHGVHSQGELASMDWETTRRAITTAIEVTLETMQKRP